MTTAKASELGSAVAAVLPGVVSARHHLHRHPELSWQETKTQAYLLTELEKLGSLKITPGIAKTGILAVLDGEGGAGPHIALRADMDGLPVNEASDLPHGSTEQGVMHACGHDGHMAVLLGAVKVLHELRGRLRGRVSFIFQPAEEGGAGAKVICDEGVLTRAPKVDAIFGLHGWPQLKVGTMGWRSGALMASTCEFEIKILGKGMHGAMPHLGTDQILIGARVVDSLQVLTSRHVSPVDPLVVTVGTFHGGTATNVVPSEVVLTGTIRALSDDVQSRCVAQLKRLVNGICEAHGAAAEITIDYGYPPTINHEGPSHYVRDVGEGVFGKAHVLEMAAPSMGGEDFAYYLQHVPGSYFFLGVDDGRSGGYPSLHHPHYDFNDKALPLGITMFAELALQSHRLSFG